MRGLYVRIVSQEPFSTMKYDTITISKEDLKLCLKYTKNCLIGGASPITQGRESKKLLLINNFIGQVGTLAGCIYLYGEERGREEYIAARELADLNPYQGDGGQDIVDQNIDIKCSYMRSSSDPTMYNFLLRPRDVHPDWTYIQTLAMRREDGLMDVHIMGWVKTEDLPKKVQRMGVFKGAYKIPIAELREFPIPHFKGVENAT